MRPLTIAVLLVALACGRGSDRAPSNDTTAAAASAPGSAAATRPSSTPWPAALGGLLVIGGTTPRSGVLLLADSVPDVDALAVARGAELELMSTTGRVGIATIAAAEPADSAECQAWPVARLQFGRDSVGLPWTLATRRGVATALPTAELASMGARDSANLVMELARLASGLAGDTNPAFRGLPMVVRAAARFAPAAGVDAVFAEVVRRVGQEAKPLEERVAVLAERASGPGATWRATWVQRIDGLEETIEAADLVGAITLMDGTPVLVVQRESARGVRYELLVRTAAGWERRWASLWSGC